MKTEQIALKALLYAIAGIQGLPKDRQPVLDLFDMCEVALSRDAHSHHPHLVREVERVFGSEVDLWPNHLEMTDQDRYDKAAMRLDIDELNGAFGHSADPDLT